jgi:hypothetical protein
MSILKVDQLQSRTGGNITSPNTIISPGTVIQVLHASKGDTMTATGAVGNNYWVSVTGLSVTITPKSATSKIIIMTHMYVGMPSEAAGYQQQYRILKNGVLSTAVGNAEGGRPQVSGRINMYGAQTTSDIIHRMGVLSGVHQVDAGSTSAATYSIELRGYTGSTIVYVNRSSAFQSSGQDYDGVPLSTLTVMEIAQ